MMPPTDRNRLAALPWIGLAVAIAAMLWLVFAWSQARREADSLRAWQATILQRIATARGGDTPLSPDQAADALVRIVAAREGAETLAAAPTPSAVPPAPPPPAPSKDATTEIARLTQTQSTGTAAGDAQIIEQDSRAAWTGWK